MSREISRRKFLEYLAYAAGGAALFGTGISASKLFAPTTTKIGTETPPPKKEAQADSSLLQKIDSLLDIPINPTYDQLAKLSYEKSVTEPNWATNTELGSYINTHGDRVGIRTDEKGELIYDKVNKNFDVIYPDQKQAFFDSLNRGENYIIFYGKQDSVDRFTNNGDDRKKSIIIFLEELFKNSKTKINVLHVNFCANKYQINLKTNGIKFISEFSAYSMTNEPTSDPQKKATEIVFNVHNWHNYNVRVGHSLPQGFRRTFANEMANIMALQYPNSDVPDNQPFGEAFSSLAGLGVMFNKDKYAPMFLGDLSKIEPFFKLIEDEANLLKR